MTVFLGSGTLTNVNNLIQGETKNLGSIGFGQIGIINQSAGVIDANASGFALDVEPSAVGLTNAGTMRASNGGILFAQRNGWRELYEYRDNRSH